MVQIVKLGGSVLTHPDRPEVREDALERLAGELADVDDDVVVVHGAGSFGHPGAAEHGLDQGLGGAEAAAGLAEVHASVRELNLAVLESLRGADLAPVTFSPFGWLSCNDGRPGGWNLIPIHRGLEQGLVPVSHGDVVLDTTRGISVLSGDRIVAELARFLEADRLVFALDQDGVFSHPPDHEDAELLEAPGPDTLKAARERATAGDGPDVTGGMATKIERAVETVRSGTEVCLVNGLKAGRVRDALAGKPVGTVLEPGGS